MAHTPNTLNDMIAVVKRKAMLPASQQLFSDDDLVDYIADEMSSVLLPKTMSIREEYFVDRLDVTFVTDQVFYDLPSRAVGAKIRDIVLVTDDGTEINVPRLTSEEISKSRGIGASTFGFFFEGNKIGFHPVNNNPTTSFRIKYFRRPNHPVLEKNAGQVLSWNTTTKIVTLSRAIPNLAVNGYVDIMDSNSPYGPVADSVQVTAIAGNTITVESTFDFTVLTVGDWVTLEYHAPVIQMPTEAHEVIIQSAVTSVLSSMQDPGTKIASELYQQKLMNYLDMMKDRVEGEPKRIVGSQNISTYAVRSRYGRYTGR